MLLIIYRIAYGRAWSSQTSTILSDGILEKESSTPSGKSVRQFQSGSHIMGRRSTRANPGPKFGINSELTDTTQEVCLHSVSESTSWILGNSGSLREVCENA